MLRRKINKKQDIIDTIESGNCENVWCPECALNSVACGDKNLANKLIENVEIPIVKFRTVESAQALLLELEAELN